MGAAIPGVTGLLHQPTGQVIDGSLKFDSSKSQYLTRTPSSSGNKRTWTYSAWIKRNKVTDTQGFFESYRSSSPGSFFIGTRTTTDDFAIAHTAGYTSSWATPNEIRDIGWYHFMVVSDTTSATSTISNGSTDRYRVYINGEQVSISGGTVPSQNFDTQVNDSSYPHYIGRFQAGGFYCNSQMSQVYLIDGQALGPEYFGFTDPLTNTWKPKKLNLSDVTSGKVFVENTYTGGTVGSGIYNAALTGTQTAGSYSGDTFTATNAGWVLTFDLYEFDSFTLSDVTSSGESNETWYYSNDSSFASGVTGPNSGTIADGTWSTTVSGTKYRYLRLQNVPSITFSVVGNITNSQNAWGVNGFYLPMDGNSPIGQDKSGQGNNWTSVNFGGPVALDNPQVSGARPILNTTQGGTQAGVGVFGSKENKYYTVTTADGSVYQFDITSGDNPSLSFIRGATYKFDYSSFTGHPVLFSSTNPDSSTTAYTDGTDIASNVISFTVPHNAPDTLYYYCQNHPTSMNGSISVTTDETKADPYAWKNVLALPLVGSATDVSASIACTSSTKELSTNGNAAAASESSNFYSGSFEFDGTNDDVRYTSPGAIGTGDFTLECWVNFDVLNANQGVVDTRSDSNTNGFALLGRSDGTVSMADGTSLIGDAISASAGRWIHLAGSRSGSSLKFFVDGKLSSTVTNSTNFSNDRLIVGTIGGGTEDLNGYVQDVRLYLGVAKYTSDFVVPATSPDILPDTPSGVSGGSKLTKITDGAVTFDGSGDYLEATSSTDFAFGTGDFTLEAYIYATSLPNTNNRVFCSGAGDSGNRSNFQLMVGSTGYLEFDNTSTYQSATGLISTGRWYHVAATKASGTLRLFIDGVKVKEQADSYNVTENGGVTIGREFGYTSYFNGFISNARIIKGTALYTSDFTPPTRALTNVTNTKLLCCQSPTSVVGFTTAPGDGFSTQIYSAGITTGTALNASGSTGWVQAFDGNTSTLVYPGDSNGSTEITLPTPVAWSSTIRIYAGQNATSGTNIIANGVNLSASHTWALSGDWQDVTSSLTSPLTSLKLINVGGQASNIRAVEIDGNVLTDAIVRNGDVAATTFNPFNTDINTVRGQETGYATLNPLINGASTLSDGNLTATAPSGSTHGRARSTLTMDTSGTGKFYFEATITVLGGTYPHFGVIDSVRNSDATYVGDATNCFSYRSDGQKQLEGTASSYGDSYAVGDTIGCSLDCGSGELRFYKNGVDQGVAKTITANYDACFAVSNYGSSGQWKVNFGQKPFKFPPPDGFQPLNGANVRPETVIARPDQYVGIVTYTGDSTDNRQIRVGMQPDLVWTKRRDTALDHHMWDSVRGAAYELYPNQNYEQGGPVSPLRFAGFNYDGFTVNNHSVINQTGNWVAWCWKAGGNKNTFNIDDVGYANASDVNMSVGTLNSSLYNQSQTWSSSLTISGSWDGGSSAANAFDGLLSTNARAMGQNMQITFDITSTPLTFTDKVELYTSSSGMDVSVNGGTAQVPATNQFVTIASGGGTLNTITFDNVNAKTVVTALRVDGKLLVDPNAITTPSIAATGCSVGTKQGFSIIKYTGTGTAGTIPHGLLEQPKFVVIKDLKNANAWAVQHVGTTLGTGLLKWGSSGNSAVDSSVASPVWNSTAPTSSVFSVGTSGDTNYTTNSAEYIAYLWHDVPGLQKFGSYTGNGSTTSGAFVQLDFKPALIWVKRRDSGSAYSSWAIYDSTRSKFNTTGTSAYNFPLWINRDAQEGKRGNGTDAASGAENIINLFSNGFMALGAGAELNVANEQYIYCAWAEVPTFNLYGGQANAR